MFIKITHWEKIYCRLGLSFPPRATKSSFCVFPFLHRDWTKVTFMWKEKCLQKVIIQQHTFLYLLTSHQNSMEAKVRYEFRRKVDVLDMQQNNLSNSESLEYCYVLKLYFNIFVAWLHLRLYQSHVLFVISKKGTMQSFCAGFFHYHLSFGSTN